MTLPFSALAANLDDLALQGLYRSRRVSASPQGIMLEIDGNNVVNFCSNDYLGLANHPDVVQAFKNATDHYGVGSGSAHLICGHSAAHHALEEELAAFTGRDRALLFSTGYMANLGVISALVGRGDAVFEDRLNHASLLDGGLLSGARFKRYAHADVADLGVKLNEAVGNKLIVTDGVFSMDGDFAPLDEMSVAAKSHKAWLMVDDAHGLGVIGEQGGGVLEHYGLNQDDVPVLMGTLGKGLGTFGAFVAGSDLLIETLIQKARTYIYTTAMPAAIAEATRASLKIVITESWRRDKLKQLSARFRLGAEQLGLTLMASSSAIQPILIGDSQTAVDLSNALLKNGFLVSAIRPPTVPQGSARLRVTFSALHEQQHVDQLLDALDQSLLNLHVTKIHLETFGVGKPIVLVHGWAMHSGIWRGFARCVAQHYQVICVDLPGHGRSEKIDPFTLERISDELVKIIPPAPLFEKGEQGGICWLGWSLGATIVLDIAARYPERVSALVLLAGNPSFPGSSLGMEDWPGMNSRLLDDFAEHLNKNCQATLLRFLSLQVNGLPEHKVILKDLKKAVLECAAPDKKTLQGGLDLLKKTDLRPVLAELKIPVSVILGGLDTLVPVAVGQKMQQLLPSLELNVIDRAGHVPFLSHCRETVAIISRFMDQRCS